MDERHFGAEHSANNCIVSVNVKPLFFGRSFFFGGGVIYN